MNFVLRNQKTVEIRRLTAVDATQFNPFMQQIARESTHTLRYVGQPESDPKEIAERWENASRSDEKLYLGALFDGRLVGYLLATKPFPDHPWMRHLAHFVLMITEEFGGVGLGREMLRQLDQFALEAGITRMEATVRTNNERALSLYLKSGYEIEGLRRRAALVEGDTRDEHFIAKLYTHSPK